MYVDDKTMEIYDVIYSDERTNKDNFTKVLGYTCYKTLEKLVKDLDEIVYDLDLREYRFKDLLPKFITRKAFLNIIAKNSIPNKLLKNDFILINTGDDVFENKAFLTSSLSKLSQKLIMFHNAIKYNCVLKIEYKPINRDFETKIIRPHSCFSKDTIYYVFASYDAENMINIGEERTFAFNSIKSIEALKFLKSPSFKIDFIGNAYGMFKKDNYVFLEICDEAAAFFKRELLNNQNFEFINEELDGKIINIKMYYNIEDEIVHLLKHWMPLIKIQSNIELKKRIYNKIQNDFKNFFKEEN